MIQALKESPPEEIIAFDGIFWELEHEAYRADLWDVVSTINRGCGDDSFAYFRWWLVMQGRDVYETAMADVQSLAEINAAAEDLPTIEGEWHADVGRKAYKLAAGVEMPPQPLPPGRSHLLKGRLVKSDTGIRRKYPMVSRLMRAKPVIDLAWLKWGRGTVKRIAREIQAERRWADLPVLADALEDAGCSDEFLLGHLREGRRHARHCWAIHLLLRPGRPG